jgi:AbrB family looped-hinge helix DNA binding protein
MPTLQQRSVIDMGQGSYVITLPKPWLRYFGIQPGDKLEIETDGDLIIRRPKRKRQNQRRGKVGAEKEGR